MLETLVIPVIAIAGLAIARLLRRGLAADLPMVVLLVGLVAIGVASLTLEDDPLTWQGITILAGLVLGEVPMLFERASSLARIRGSYRTAARIGVVAWLLRPTAKQLTLLRLSRLLQQAVEGRLTQDAGHERLQALAAQADRIRDTATSLTLRGGLLPAAIARGAWQAVADSYDPSRIQLYAWPPNPAGTSMVIALCRAGRTQEAAELVAATAGAVERILPPECDAWRNQGRLAFLAHAGSFELVRRALRRGGPLSALFRRADRSALIATADARTGVSLAPADAHDTFQSVAETEAAIAVESRLANAFSHLRSPAPATLALLAANVLVFVLTWGAWGELSILYGAASDFGVIDQGQAWRLVSSAILHAHWLHLAMNGAFLLLFGNIVERFVGPGRFLAIYLAAAVGGGLAAVTIGASGPMVGSSGAIFGLVGATLVLLRRHRQRLPDSWYRRNQAWCVGLLIVSTVLGAMVPFISMAAHGGGLVAGGAAAFAVDALEGRGAGALRRLGVAVLAAAYLGCSWVAVDGVMRSAAAPAGELIPLEVRVVPFADAEETVDVELAAPWRWDRMAAERPASQPLPLQVLTVAQLRYLRVECPTSPPSWLADIRPGDSVRLAKRLSERRGLPFRVLADGSVLGDYTAGRARGAQLVRLDEAGFFELWFALDPETVRAGREIAEAIMAGSRVTRCERR